MGLLARVKGQRGHGADRNETVKFYQKMKEGEGGFMVVIYCSAVTDTAVK